MLIYRRLVLLTHAHAEVQSMARVWAVIIEGNIGINPFRALECYIKWKTAKDRSFDVNRRHMAYIESIDEILFPLSFIHNPLDTGTQKTSSFDREGKSGKKGESILPYSKVEDVYELRALDRRHRKVC